MTWKRWNIVTGTALLLCVAYVTGVLWAPKAAANLPNISNCNPQITSGFYGQRQEECGYFTNRTSTQDDSLISGGVTTWEQNNNYVDNVDSIQGFETWLYGYACNQNSGNINIGARMSINWSDPTDYANNCSPGNQGHSNWDPHNIIGARFIISILIGTAENNPALGAPNIGGPFFTQACYSQCNVGGNYWFDNPTLQDVQTLDTLLGNYGNDQGPVPQAIVNQGGNVNCTTSGAGFGGVDHWGDPTNCWSYGPNGAIDWGVSNLTVYCDSYTTYYGDDTQDVAYVTGNAINPGGCPGHSFRESESTAIVFYNYGPNNTLVQLGTLERFCANLYMAAGTNAALNQNPPEYHLHPTVNATSSAYIEPGNPDPIQFQAAIGNYVSWQFGHIP